MTLSEVEKFEARIKELENEIESARSAPLSNAQKAHPLSERVTASEEAASPVSVSALAVLFLTPLMINEIPMIIVMIPADPLKKSSLPGINTLPSAMPPTIQIRAKPPSISPRRMSIRLFFAAMIVMTRAFPQSTSRLENRVRYRSNPQTMNNTGTISGQAVNPMALAAIPINRDNGTRTSVNSRIGHSPLDNF